MAGRLPVGDDGRMVEVTPDRPTSGRRRSLPRKSAQVALLANPVARRGQAAADVSRVLDRMRHRGIEPLVLDASSADEARAAARRAVEVGISRLVAIGGDGVAHMVAGAAAGSPTVVGVVAAGTGNDAATALGLATGDLDDRTDRALADPVPVDLLECRNGDHPSSPTTADRHALTSCIAGFPAVVNVRAEAMPWPRGPSRYTLATLGTILRMRPGLFRLALTGGPDGGPGRVLEQRAAVVVVANLGLFGGGMRICPDARPDDGLLDLCLVGDVGRLALLRAFPKVRTGAHLDHPAVTVLRVAGLSVEMLDGDPTVRADGEPFGALPATFRVRAGALLVAGASTDPPGRA